MFRLSLSRFVQSHARNGMSLSFSRQVKLVMSNQPNVLATGGSGAPLLDFARNQEQDRIDLQISNQDLVAGSGAPFLGFSQYHDQFRITRLSGYFEALRSKKEYDNAVTARKQARAFKNAAAILLGRVVDDNLALPQILPFPVEWCMLVDLIRLNAIQNTKNVDQMGLSKNVDLIIDIMSDLAHKIGRFHQSGAVLCNLDPQNMFVTEDKCELASIDNEDCDSLGWKAPEQLLYNGLTKASNMFSFGCILYYCITGGFHPFGDTSDERIHNIKANKMDISRAISDDAYNLISRLLSPEPGLRPKANEVLSHPFFWDLTSKVRFLRTLHIITHEDRILINELESKVPLLMNQDWCKKLNDYFDVLHAIGKPTPKEIPEDVFGPHGSPTFLPSILMRAYEIAIKLYDNEEHAWLTSYKSPKNEITCLE